MHRSALIVVLFVSLMLPASLLSAPGNFASQRPKLPDDIKITKFEFGARDHRGYFTPTTLVDVRNTPSYGWRMEIETSRPTIKWKEIIRLPSPAAQWGVGPDTIVSADKTVGTTTITQTVYGGRLVIEQFWIYAPGDPPGRYRAEVFLDGYDAKTIEFDVVVPSIPTRTFFP